MKANKLFLIIAVLVLASACATTQAVSTAPTSDPDAPVLSLIGLFRVEMSESTNKAEVVERIHPSWSDIYVVRRGRTYQLRANVIAKEKGVDLVKIVQVTKWTSGRINGALDVPAGERHQEYTLTKDANLYYIFAQWSPEHITYRTDQFHTFGLYVIDSNGRKSNIVSVEVQIQ